MKKLLMLLVCLCLAGCANLPSVEIEYEGMKYKRTGEQEIGNLSVTTPDGLEIKLDSLSNSEAEEYNKAMFMLLQALIPLVE